MATRYWVNGASGSWSDTANWSNTSSGAGGASVPTAADDVIVDYGIIYPSTMAINSIAACNSFTVQRTELPLTIYIYNGASLNVTGNLSFSNWDATFGSAGPGKLIFDGQGTTTIGGSLIHNDGPIEVNAVRVKCNAYTTPSNAAPNSGDSARILTLNSGAVIEITSTTSGTQLSLGSTAPALTVNNNGGSFNFSGAIASGATRTITYTATTVPANSIPSMYISGGASGSTTVFTASTLSIIDFTGYSGTWNIANALTLRGPTTADTCRLQLSSSMTVSGTAVLTFGVGSGSIVSQGTTLTCPIVVNNTGGIVTLSQALTTSNSVTLTAGTLNLVSRTLTCLSFSSTNSNARTIGFGTGKIVVTNAAAATVWDTGTITNLTISGTPLVEVAAAGTTTRTINTGALSAANSISFSLLLSAAGTVTFTAGSVVRNLTVNMTGGGTLSNSAITIYGNVDTIVGTLTAGTNAWTFGDSGTTSTLSGFGITWDFPIIFNGSASSWQLSTNITVGATRTTTLTAGTLNVTGWVWTTGLFSSSNSNTRVIAFGTSGRIDLSSTTATTTLLTLTTATGLSTTGTPLIGIIGAGTQARVISNGYSVNEATAWNYRVNTTGGSTALPAFSNDVTLTAGTIAGTLNVYGSFTYTAGTLPTVNFLSTGTGNTITGSSIPANLVFNGVGGTWTPSSGSSTAAANGITLTNGNLSVSNITFTTGTFSSSNSNTRSITFGTTGRIDLSSTIATTTLLNLTTATGLTVSGTPTFGIVGAGTQARNINTSNGYSTDETTAWNYVVNTTGGSTVLPAFSRNVTLTSGAIAGSWLYVYGSLTYTAGTLPTVYFRSTGSGNTVTGSSIPASLVFEGVGGTWTLSNGSSTTAAASITLTNGNLSVSNITFTTGIFSSSNSNTRSIDFGTSGRIDLSGQVTTPLVLTTATGLTVTGTPTIGIVSSGAQTRTITNGYSVSEATAWDYRINTSGGETILPTYTRTVTHVAGEISNGTLSIYGGYIWTAGTVISGTINFIATSGTWPLAFTNFSENLVFNGSGGTWQLTQNCTLASNETTLLQGTLDLNEFSLKTRQFNSETTGIRAVDFGSSGRIIVEEFINVNNVGTSLTFIGNKALGVYGTGSTITIPAAVDEATAWDLYVESSVDRTINGAIKTLYMISGGIDTNPLTLYGGLVYTEGNFDAPFATITFAATSGTWPVTFTDLDDDFVFNGAGGTWYLTRNCSTSNTRKVTLTAGTLDLNEFVLTTGQFISSNSNVRSIDFGAAGRIDLSSTTLTMTMLDITTATNLSVVGTPTIGTVGAGSQSRVVTNGYAVSEATAWNFRVNTTGGNTQIPAFTRTLTQVAGNVANSTLGLYGGLIWTAGTVSPGGNPVNFVATSGTWPLTFTNLPARLVFNGVGGTWQLTTASSLTATQSATVTNGTLNLNAFVFTAGSLVMDGGTIAFGTSKIVATILSGTAVNITGGTTTGTPLIELTGASVSGDNRLITCTVPILVNVTAGASGSLIGLTTQVHSVTFSGTFAGTLSNLSVQITGSLTLKTGMVVGSGPNLVRFDGTSGTQVISSAGLTFNFPVWISGSNKIVQLASALTISAAEVLTLSSGTLDLNNFALSVGRFVGNNSPCTIAFGTTGSITLTTTLPTTIWNTSFNTNFTTTGTTNVIAANVAGAKTINTGDIPESSALNFTILTPAAVTFTGNVKNLTLNNASLVFDPVDMVVFGNFTTTALSSFASDATPITFAATSGTQTVTTAAKTVNSPIVISGTSTVTLGGALTTSSSITLTSGTFNAATYAVTVTSLASNNTNTRSLLMGTGQWTLTGDGMIWDLSTTTGLTFTKSTSTLVLSSTASAVRVFAGGSLAYNAITIGGTTGTSTTTFTGSNTFTTFASTKTVAHTLQFAAGTTTTVTTWSVTGTSGNIVTMEAFGSGTYTLAAGATAFQINFMSISNCTATSSPNVWYASRSTDGGGNTGINFFARPLFWIGGTGTWNDSTTGKWSYTSGGASSGTVPGIDSDVTFNANSDSAAVFTVTVSTGATCRDLLVSGLQYTMTFAGTGGLTIYGSMTFPATLFTRTYTGAITFATYSLTDSATRTITLGGKTLASAINFGTGSASDVATWILSDAFTTTAASGVTLTRGNLSLSSYTLTTPIFASSNTNNRSINFGTGKIVLTSTVLSTIWDTSVLTNFAAAGTSLVEVTSTGATTKTINTGTGDESQAVSFSILGGAAGSVVSVSSGSIFKNLNINSTSTVNLTGAEYKIYGNLSSTNSTTQNPIFNGGSLYFAGTTGTQTINLDNNTATLQASVFIGSQTGLGGSTVQLLNNLFLVSAHTLNIYRSFDANNRAVRAGQVTISGEYYPTINMGSGTWSLSGTGTVWNISGNGGSVTLNSGTSKISLTDTSATSRIFNGGGHVYNDFEIGGTTGSSTLTMNSNATFNTFSSTKTVAHTILFAGGSTNTFSNFTVTGTAGNVVTIGSTDTTQATLSKPTVWYVGSNSINSGNNDNLIFSGGNNIDYLDIRDINGDPPIPASSGFFMFCT